MFALRNQCVLMLFVVILHGQVVAEGEFPQQEWSSWCTKTLDILQALSITSADVFDDNVVEVNETILLNLDGLIVPLPNNVSMRIALREEDSGEYVFSVWNSNGPVMLVEKTHESMYSKGFDFLYEDMAAGLREVFTETYGVGQEIIPYLFGPEVSEFELEYRSLDTSLNLVDCSDSFSTQTFSKLVLGLMNPTIGAETGSARVFHLKQPYQGYMIQRLDSDKTTAMLWEIVLAIESDVFTTRIYQDHERIGNLISDQAKLKELYAEFPENLWDGTDPRQLPN